MGASPIAKSRLPAPSLHHNISQSEPRDLVDLPQGLANLGIHLVLQALLEGTQDSRAVGQPDTDDERKTKALSVTIIKIGEAFELVIRKPVQAKARLLPRRGLAERPGSRQLPGQVRVRTDQRQLLLVGPGFDRHPHRGGESGPVLERPLLSHLPSDPLGVLVDPSELRDEAVFLHRIQIRCR